jgi:tRNA (guanine-N7-)-methyltransferase
VVEAERLRVQGLEHCLGAPPIVLEIGFGRAELLMDLAEERPEQAFLGVEVSRKRVLKAGRRISRRGLENVRLVNAPAEYLLERVLPASCVSECWINCPDPWPKKRHFKRRLVRRTFLEQLARALVPGALLHISTDHEGYRDWIAEALVGAPDFDNLHAPDRWSSQPPARRETAYEAEWRAEGRSLAYFDYRRTK